MNAKLVAVMVLSALCGPAATATKADEPPSAPPRPGDALAPPSDAVPAPLAAEGWGVHGQARLAYRVVEDAAVTRDGHSTYRFAPTGEPGGNASFMRVLDVGEYAGKRVRVVMHARTAGASGRADFWARTQGLTAPRDPRLQSSASVDLPADGDWERRELLLDVQQEALKLQYGVSLNGPGTIWIDGPTLEVVGPAGADAPAVPH